MIKSELVSSEREEVTKAAVDVQSQMVQRGLALLGRDVMAHLTGHQAFPGGTENMAIECDFGQAGLTFSVVKLRD